MNKFLTTLLVAAALAGPAFGEDHAIDQKDRSFSIVEITIKPGDNVIFQNKDDVTHNVFSVSKENSFNIRAQTPGDASKVNFKDEGVTEVRCAIHPKMKLLITVRK